MDTTTNIQHIENIEVLHAAEMHAEAMSFYENNEKGLTFTALDEPLRERSSIFTGHYLQPKNETCRIAKKNLGFENNWMFGLMLVVFLLYGWIISNYFSKIKNTFFSLVSNRMYNKNVKAGTHAHDYLMPIMWVFVIFSLSLLIYFYFTFFYIKDFFSDIPVNFFGKILIGLILFFLLKASVVKVSSWIFKENALSSVYLNHIYNFDTCFSLISFPLIIFILANGIKESGIVLLITFIIFCFFLIFRLIRLLSIAKLFTKFSYVHIFLYFCTLEILFALLIIKFFESIINI